MTAFVSPSGEAAIVSDVAPSWGLFMRRDRSRHSQGPAQKRGIANHRLVEIADLNFNGAVAIGDRPEIARVTIAVSPDRGALGYGPALRSSTHWQNFAMEPRT